MFADEEFEFVSISSESGVSDQPIGQDETRTGLNCTLFSCIGAINRVKDAFNKWNSSNSAIPEFVIGLEVFFFLLYFILGWS